jgi:hypothetical protein
MEFEDPLVGRDGMAGIRATIGARNDRGVRRQGVGELAFPFVAPLSAHDDRGGHGSSSPIARPGEIGSLGVERFAQRVELTLQGDYLLPQVKDGGGPSQIETEILDQPPYALDALDIGLGIKATL